jgi:signal transduction histidine kinase/FixJ family two-component response regulator/HPt (histidine-containing phosphotransfer) domain-containing protein
MEKDRELLLTDLIDIKTLQRIQDDFSAMTGIAALITDENGIMVTEGSNFSIHCREYMRKSPVGCERCQKCDKTGAELAVKNGKPVLYVCHAGLKNFSAPIMAGDKLVGCFVGGQILTESLSTETLRRTASEMGLDQEAYAAAAEQVRIVDQKEIDNAIEILTIIADILSDMAYNKYLVYFANIEVEKSAKMKSDFLANMSHEIRTPMNAVIGMAEMALREELPVSAREYINQIKEAGKSLLAIINDILDFSKIESGKMDINLVDYEPMSMIYDVANIVQTRLKEKDVELILEVSPSMPNKLLGDNIRIKQILLNLANNAAKFTHKGEILLKMDFAKVAENEIEMHVAVKDTGIGIKKEDISRLFQSFQQVDSKRNRNIEGTGLGLAISKQLLTLMNGNIWVESEYDKGSQFSFILPQEIKDETPCISVKEPSGMLIAGLISNPYVRDSLSADAVKLGVGYFTLHSWRELNVLPGKGSGKKVFFFIEYPLFSDVVEAYVRDHPEITGVLLINFYDHVKYDIPNLMVVKKPLFVLNLAMILNGETLLAEDDNVDKRFEFIAPEAEVLIVDDNAVNLTVAEGLLEPLKMKIDTAISGKAAVDKITKRHYDIVFMDHMMPELDGVETTHIIRRFHPEYNDVPIIALTANAVDGTKEMFCREGMNDFVAKPIELRILVSKVKQWLPPEKIQRAAQSTPQRGGKTNIRVGDLDVSYALKFLGSEDLFWTVLKVYYRSIEKKAELIKALEEQEDWPGFTIEVHALKSSSKQIGAIGLSEKAAALEKAGNARDSAFIHRRTDEMLLQYMGYLPILEPFCTEKQEKDGKEKISAGRIHIFFSEMRVALEDLDMDKMEDVIREMSRYGYEGWQQELFSGLKSAVEDVDVDNCEAILQQWERRL